MEARALAFANPAQCAWALSAKNTQLECVVS